MAYIFLKKKKKKIKTLKLPGVNKSCHVIFLFPAHSFVTVCLKGCNKDYKQIGLTCKLWAIIRGTEQEDAEQKMERTSLGVSCVVLVQKGF